MILAQTAPIQVPWITLIATLLSPVIAVVITLWWQQRKEKRDAKIHLFLDLMAHRKGGDQKWVDSLNLIDVVFHDSQKVVNLWHRYYEALCTTQSEANYQRIAHDSLALLSQMAKELGYHSIQQTDIDKFYSPRSHGDQAELNYKCQKEWLRVLEASAKIAVEPKESTLDSL